MRSVLNWLAARFESDAEDTEPEDGGFRPSRLDASVRYAHGTSDTDVEGEIANLEAEAERLENNRRGD